MEILLFDMDGVLLKSIGYHRALQETVRLAGCLLGLDDVWLSEDQIAQFEALGISSEWHSSALCNAVMTLEKQKSGVPQEDNSNLSPYNLGLQELFEAISTQSPKVPALQRALQAVKSLAAQAGISPDEVVGIVENSASMAHSPTMNWFQELVLGSDIYENTYQKNAQLHIVSYLEAYDQRLITEQNTSEILQLVSTHDYGAAIMTNRPSNKLLGDTGTPEAELGAALVGLENLPLVGFGEITWLAEQSGLEAGVLNKPAWQHALASIMSASGQSEEASLKYLSKPLSNWQKSDFNHLQDSTITVFEDTPGGIISVQAASNLLSSIGIEIKVKKIGIAADDYKRSALMVQGAGVYPSINHALEVLDYF